MANLETEHGVIVSGRYICAGCLVRAPWEHRCHHADTADRDPREVCTCEECVHP